MSQDLGHVLFRYFDLCSLDGFRFLQSNRLLCGVTGATDSPLAVFYTVAVDVKLFFFSLYVSRSRFTGLYVSFRKLKDARQTRVTAQNRVA